MNAPVGILFNPISGGGRGATDAALIEARLTEVGIPSRKKMSQPEYEPAELRNFFQGLRSLVVVGGDGTLMPLLQPLAEMRLPVAMYPAGNESLFARWFQMTADREKLVARIQDEILEDHYFGLANGRPFFSMLSVGLDADVVARLSARRTGPVGTKGYLWPLLQSLITFRVPTLCVSEGGSERVSAKKGYLNIANCSQYARGLALVPEATSAKQELCARFYPHRTVFFYFRWLLPLLFRKPLKGVASECILAKELEVKSLSGPVCAQADGEAIGVLPVSVSISKQTIRVLGGVPR